MRVLTWNVRYGYPGSVATTDNTADYDIDAQIAALLAADLSPDIVCLQEVDIGRSRSLYENMPQKFADALWPSTTSYIAYANVAHPTTGQGGNAILSTFPLYNLKANACSRALEFADYTPVSGLPDFRRGAALAAALVAESTFVVIASCHLGGETNAQSDLNTAELEAIRSLNPAVYAGDFNRRNSTYDAANTWYDNIPAAWTDTTAGTVANNNQQDFIFTAGMTHSNEAGVALGGTSDHRGYYVDLEVAP